VPQKPGDTKIDRGTLHIYNSVYILLVSTGARHHSVLLMLAPKKRLLAAPCEIGRLKKSRFHCTHALLDAETRASSCGKNELDIGMGNIEEWLTTCRESRADVYNDIVR
jgi:hypothetical protein